MLKNSLYTLKGITTFMKIKYMSGSTKKLPDGCEEVCSTFI